ncbi:MAG: hypothetical protein AB7F89_27380 [Pirellulaceae bacterium]
MHRGVPLERLPDGLQFPAELEGKVSYCASRRELQFRGFMSKTDFDRLVCLHRDLAYQRALERLFRICTFQGPAPAKRRPAFATGLAAVAFFVMMMLAAVVWWS